MQYSFEMETEANEKISVDAELNWEGRYVVESGHEGDPDFIDIIEDPKFIFSVTSFEDDGPFELTTLDIFFMDAISVARYWSELEI